MRAGLDPLDATHVACAEAAACDYLLTCDDVMVRRAHRVTLPLHVLNPITYYLETSFVSACVTDRRDPGSLYRQSISLEWWHTQRHQHYLYGSDEVVAELSDQRYARRQEALDHIEDLESLVVSEEVIGLARILVEHKVMPGPLQGDAVHIAVATLYAMDFVLSWNVRHLANPNKTQHLNTICLRLGLIPPPIITPEFLWEDNHETSE